MFQSHMLVELLALVLACTLVKATPSAEQIALARKYAPQYRFSPFEQYFPSTIEYFLPFVKALDSDGNPWPNAPSPLTVSNIANMDKAGLNSYLSVDDMEGNKDGFLVGQKPGAGTDPVTYAFIVPKDNGVVDMFYWLFYPFNEAKSVPILGQVGDHVGDWERLAVRTVNGVATQADYHAHSDTGSTLPWDQVPKMEGQDRPIAYIAKGSHGVWPQATRNVYANALIFQLHDSTGGDGVNWDSQNHVVPILFPDTYSGDLAWVNYQGVWGNRGTTKCWWHAFVNECEVIDGPGGPLREAVFTLRKKRSFASQPRFGSMNGPLSTTIATLDAESPTSTYIFRVDPTTFELAAAAHTHLAVEQHCQSTNLFAGKWSNKEFLPLVGREERLAKFEATLPACENSSFAYSYTIGLCSSTAQDDCSWSSVRKLSTFASNVSGTQTGPVVKLDDLDNWYF